MICKKHTHGLSRSEVNDVWAEIAIIRWIAIHQRNRVQLSFIGFKHTPPSILGTVSTQDRETRGPGRNHIATYVAISEKRLHSVVGDGCFGFRFTANT